MSAWGCPGQRTRKHYAGIELPGRTLGIIGLGRIGSLVADSAIKLGMNVLGYDPEITVDAAWSLPSTVRKANSIDEVLKSSEFVTLHVPLIAATRQLINAKRLGNMRHGAVLMNFAREEVVDVDAVVEAVRGKRLSGYVCDFPSARFHDLPNIVALPHLGASTREAEENCAVMVAGQVRDYLEHGNIRNAVNFPDVLMERESPYRLAIANANVPNMLGQISTTLASAGLNIHNMLNKSKHEMAYTVVDVDSAVGQPAIDALCRGIAKEVEKLVVAGRPGVLLVSPQVRPGMKQITAGQLPQLAVLSYNEVTRDTQLESLGIVSDSAPGR